MNNIESYVIETAQEVVNHTPIIRPYLPPDNPDNHTQDECAFLDNQADAHE